MKHELCIPNIITKPHSVCSELKQDEDSLYGLKSKSV